MKLNNNLLSLYEQEESGEKEHFNKKFFKKYKNKKNGKKKRIKPLKNDDDTKF